MLFAFLANGCTGSQRSDTAVESSRSESLQPDLAHPNSPAAPASLPRSALVESPTAREQRWRDRLEQTQEIELRSTVEGAGRSRFIDRNPSGEIDEGYLLTAADAPGVRVVAVHTESETGELVTDLSIFWLDANGRPQAEGHTVLAEGVVEHASVWPQTGGPSRWIAHLCDEQMSFSLLVGIGDIGRLRIVKLDPKQDPCVPADR